MIVLAASKSVLEPIYTVMGAALAWFYNLVPSYGVAIILLTVAVRLILFPLTTKQARSMQAMQKQLASQSEGADNSAQGMAMLGLLQQLSFNGASVRFDDDSLTGKVLDYVGKQQGMSGKDVANQAKAIVPFGTELSQCAVGESELVVQAA